MSLSDNVAAEIRAEMGRQQLRNVGLAAKVGENEVWVSRKVRGLTPITIDELERFAAALDVPVGSLLPERARQANVSSLGSADQAPAADERPGHARVDGRLSRTPPMTTIRRPVVMSGPRADGGASR